MDERTPYGNQLLSLKKNVWFFLMRQRMDVFGTLFYTGSQKNSAKPNRTASMLLYLLARDNGDEIHFNQVEKLIEKKFKIPEGKTANSLLHEFLLSLETCFPREGTPLREQQKKYGILETKPAETRDDGTPVPDPMELFETDTEGWGQIDWEPPKLEPSSEEPIVKKTHFYVRPEKRKNGGTISRW